MKFGLGAQCSVLQFYTVPGRQGVPLFLFIRKIKPLPGHLFFPSFSHWHHEPELSHKVTPKLRNRIGIVQTIDFQPE